MEFRELMAKELRSMYDMEVQLTDALADMAEKATSPQLKQAFVDHRQQTMEHVRRLEQVAQFAGIDTGGEKAHVARELIKQAGKVGGDIDAGPVRDAALIMFGQKAEHMEMAVYGTMRNLCQQMGLTDAVPLLEQTLQEEKQADQLLSQLAESGINQAAVSNQGQAYAG